MFTEISLNQYRIFYAAAECGSISRAAEKLYISQPAVSRSVSSLEESFGLPLFRRGHRGVTLTEEGAVLFEHLKKAFSEIGAAEDYIRGVSDSGGGHLKIGASGVLCKYMLLPYLKGFAQQNPKVRITIECQSSRKTCGMLESGAIDLALLVPPADMSGLIFQPAGFISDVFTASPQFLESIDYHPDMPLSPQQLGELIERAGGVMLLEPQNGTRRRIDRYFIEEGIPAERWGILEVSGMDMLIEFARTGLGIACVIRNFILSDIAEGRLEEIPLKNPIGQQQVGFAVPSENASLPALRFMEYISSVMNITDDTGYSKP